MAQILVRELKPAVVERLKRRARRQGRSLQGEVKAILEQAAQVDAETARALAVRLRKTFQGRALAHSVDLIREDRRR
jgi:plasmid stability protein